MIDGVEDRLLDVPMGAALLQPPVPFDVPGALKLLEPPSGVGRGAPRVGTVWTVGIEGAGVVERETVTAPEAGAGETPLLVDVAPSVGVTRWIEGVGEEVGALLVTSGSAPEAVAGPALLEADSVSTGEPSPPDALGDSVGELVASGRSPTS